ncbi:MAG TPA: GGDEF domain-containing protein [Thermodesulfobacteriaceae bacterium]|nr:GGDEF domain-containing protein [Thermodesulfobacteriaceae bacterium]
MLHALTNTELCTVKRKKSMNQAAGYRHASEGTDPVTGLLNRTALEHDLRLEIHRAVRYCFPLSVIIVSIDGYDEISRDYGSDIACNILRKTGQMLRNSVRKVDMVYRYSNTKFVLVLPHTDKDSSSITAERILGRIRRHIFSSGGEGHKISLHASAGIAEMKVDDDPATILFLAEKALRRTSTDGGRPVSSSSGTP